MNPIQNRYEFLIIFDCENGNPNGDPDAGDLPRTDTQDGHGQVSSGSIKRRIRDYAQLLGEAILIQRSSNINKSIFEARERTGDPNATPTIKRTQDATAWLCEKFFDVRTFGAVLSTGANAGQVTGPVQINWARSIDPVHVIEAGITRVAVTDKADGATSVADFEDWEAGEASDTLQTMGRKSFIPYGLFVAPGFISAFQAQRTGFSEGDLEMLCEAIMNMFEHSRTSGKGMMSTHRLIVFKHLGTREDPEQQAQQAKLGCAPAHRLLTLGQVVRILRQDETRPPRTYADYAVSVDQSQLPEGVAMLDLAVWDVNEFHTGWVTNREPLVNPKIGRGSRNAKTPLETK
jgi:CRISPR-associated protein Csd2